MGPVAESDELENLEFKWGRKRGVGGKKKEFQFYESFTYNNVEYTLHDCVYMHKEGEPEPYIGKLMKIWEHPDKTKKVKVQWFFRPSEISNWLGDKETLENEIFLASGDGVGLANLNPLEAIAGKCNVVCISKDNRNPQPSSEDLQMADYIFYRTFDVKCYKILDKMDDKVGGLDVKFIFNRKESENAIGVSKPGSVRKDDSRNPVACNETLHLSEQTPPEESEIAKRIGSYNHLVVKEDADVKDLLVKQESLHGDVNNILVKREALPGEKPTSGAGVDSSQAARANVKEESVSGENTTRSKVDYDKDELKGSKVPINQLKAEQKVKFAKNHGSLDNRPPKKARIDSSIKFSEDKNMNSFQKLSIQENTAKAVVTNATCVDGQKKSGFGKDSFGPDKAVRLTKDFGTLEDMPSKKAKVGSSVKFSEEKNRNSVQELRVNADENDVKDLVAAVTSEEKAKVRPAKDSFGLDKDIHKKQKPDENTWRFSNGKLLRVSAEDSADVEMGTDGKEFEVPRRPDIDKRKWFRALPWEERMQSAHEHGTLVLLQNLDPEYTSGEVEEIIWDAFMENCTAKMVQRTAISSPHSGQAFAILKTREAAERVIRKLNEGFLMLSNGRPLVGSFGPPPSLPGKNSTFVGHLFIDRLKIQMQRERKEAVSTSHYSQPNTIEYGMAMDWCLLQSRSDSWWKRLYKQQGEELRKLVADLRLK